MDPEDKEATINVPDLDPPELENSEIEVVVDGKEPEVELVDEDPKKADDEDEEHSTKVRARIKREQEVTKRERARADEERAGRLEAERKLAEFEEKAFAHSFDEDIKKAKEKFDTARSEGNSDEEINAIERLAELQAQKHRTPVRKQPEQRQEPVVPENEARDEWLSRNNWYEQEDYDVQSDAAFKISTSLAGEGKDPNNPSFWEELDRRLHKAVKITGKEKPRSPVAGVKVGDPPRNPTKVSLSPSQRAMAAALKLDLTDEKVRNEYARNANRS